jgi:cytochrome c-type biogenesis protein CcmE
MNKRTLLLLTLIAVAAGAFIGYRMYNEKPAGAGEKKAEVTLTAEELFQAFTADEVAAGKQYNDKVVQVSGTIREIAVDPNGPTNVYLETSDMLAAVACEFAPGSVPAGWKKGDKAVLKGFCAGFNMDVLLQRCSIVE